MRFTVADAGERIKGAKVRARGHHCMTNTKGVCTIVFSRLKAGRFNALAKKKQYADGSVELRVG